MTEVFFVLLFTALSCALIGNFLVLRNLSMVSDAISHSVLLGIVLGYFVTGDLRSPYLLFGAALFGVLTVVVIEALSGDGRMNRDDAVGIVFPFFFALAVILITRYARNIHLDTDMVLMGEVILSPLNRVSLSGQSLPKALVQAGLMILVNGGFILVFFKELKISTFDPDFAQVSGFSSGVLFYALMSLLSLTSVVSFDAVGAILVISFLITPGATAYLVTKDLRKTILLSLLFASFHSLLGFFLSLWLNVSMSGMTATVAGIHFFSVFLFHSKGLFTQIMKRRQKRRLLRRELLVLHIANHRRNEDLLEELGIHSLRRHLNWDEKEFKKMMFSLLREEILQIDGGKGIYDLTGKGERYCEEIYKTYGLDPMH